MNSLLHLSRSSPSLSRPALFPSPLLSLPLLSYAGRSLRSCPSQQRHFTPYGARFSERVVFGCAGGRLVASDGYPSVLDGSPMELPSTPGHLDAQVLKKQRTGEGSGATTSSASAAGSAQAPEDQPQTDGSQKKKKNKESGKKGGVNLLPMFMAAKHNDLDAMMKFFDTAVLTGDTVLPFALLNPVMFVACGGEMWEGLARKDPLVLPHLDPAVHSPAKATAGRPPPAPRVPLSAEALEDKRQACIAASAKVWDYMQQHGAPPDDVMCVTLARMEAIKGNPSGSLDWAHFSITNNKQPPPALRLFHPALVGYSLVGDVAAVKRIDALIKELDLEFLDLTEYEYALMLETFAKTGSWADFSGVLMRMQRELNQLQPSTLAIIGSYFGGGRAQDGFLEASVVVSPAGTAQAGERYNRWSLQSGCAVEPSGMCPAAGASVKLVDLLDHEWDLFAEGIANLARREEGVKGMFDEFIRWYDANGPYDVVIDAANVAFFGTGGLFIWRQIMLMVQHVRAKNPPTTTVLGVLHESRLTNPRPTLFSVKAFVDDTMTQGYFYYAPRGSNDDWYWLYASARAKHKGLLISNDEMRDHIFGMLRPKYFLKWKSIHVAHYSFAAGQTRGGVLLEHPAAYTPCVQRLDNGVWVFPCNDGTWMVAKPEA